MGLFKKPTRNFRQRTTFRRDSDEERSEEEAPEASDKKPKEPKPATLPTEKPIPGPSNLKVAPSTSKEDKSESQTVIPATKLLSFHDEEDDGEVFKLKKSNYSRRMAKQLEKERKKRIESSSLNVPSTSKNVAPFKNATGKTDSSKQSKELSNILSGKDAEDMDVDDGEDNKEVKKDNPFKEVLISGVIPDAAMIYAMKKHRQMAREMGDFIPLEEPENEDDNPSRLIRDDDNDRSDDDDDEPSRLSFTVNTAAAERQKVREAFLSLQEGPTEELENEDAAELDRWEQEQIRKGVSAITQSGAAPQQDTQYYPYGITEDVYSYPTPPTAVIDIEHNLSKAHIVNFAEVNKTDLKTSDIKLRLGERLNALKALNETHKNELEMRQKEIEEANELIIQMEKEAPELARRYSLFQQMRGYVKDLVECLDLKVAHVEVLETKLMELYKTRAKWFLSRRQLDVRDQADEYSLLASRILKGSAAEITIERNGGFDESKTRRTAERDGRRMRRRKNRERLELITKHQEGMSTDDEEPDAEKIKFTQSREAILNECKEVFEDVVEDFGTIQGIMLNFGKWKCEQEESYTEAFVPLCLPKIFSPFVRLEMFPWNPLEEEPDFESTVWYNTLAYFSSENSDQVLDKIDPDFNLLPSIIEKVLVPKITGFIKDVWDPLSTTQTKNLVSLINKFRNMYPTVSGKSKPIQTMIQAVPTRITQCLDEDVYIPMYPKELLENRSLGSSVFFQRQFWSGVKLLNNILMWDGLLADVPIRDLALTSLLNRYLLMGLHTSMMMTKETMERCKAIVSSLPKAWFAKLSGSASIPQMKSFSQFLLKYGQSFQAPTTKKHYMDEDEIKDTVKDIIQLLIIMNSLDEAVVLAKQYSITGLKK